MVPDVVPPLESPPVPLPELPPLVPPLVPPPEPPEPWPELPPLPVPEGVPLLLPVPLPVPELEGAPAEGLGCEELPPVLDVIGCEGGAGGELLKELTPAGAAALGWVTLVATAFLADLAEVFAGAGAGVAFLGRTEKGVDCGVMSDESSARSSLGAICARPARSTIIESRFRCDIAAPSEGTNPVHAARVGVPAGPHGRLSIMEKKLNRSPLCACERRSPAIGGAPLRSEYRLLVAAGSLEPGAAAAWAPLRAA